MNKLEMFFNHEGYNAFGSVGDHNGWTAEETAVYFLKELLWRRNVDRANYLRKQAESLIDEAKALETAIK